MRQLAPSGTPIGIKEFSAWLGTIFSQDETMEQFTTAICNYFGVKYCYFLSTGRAAMALLLQAMSELAEPNKNTIIIPSYTCFSVPSSVIKAGLKIKVCDVNPHTLDYDYQKLVQTDFSQVLGIISGNLYGIPNDLDLLEKVAREKNIFLIDDAAQCMGGISAGGRFAGTYGDAGLFSLDKGKVITSMNGGIVVTNSSRIASNISSKVEHLPSPSTSWCTIELAKMFAYSVFLRPALYWVPAGFPLLKLGTTLYTTDYPLQKYNKLLGGIAYTLFEHLSEINRIRIDNGEYYRKNLPETAKLKHIEVKPSAHPIYLRYPIRVADKQLRNRAILALKNNGLGATKSFPSSVVDIDQLNKQLFTEEKNAVGGRIVADQILTLPAHPFVTRSDQNRIISILMDTVQ